MHFEVTLRSNETYEKHFSYGIVFIPCPVWVKGDLDWVKMNVRYGKGRYADLQTKGDSK